MGKLINLILLIARFIEFRRSMEEEELDEPLEIGTMNIPCDVMTTKFGITILN